MTDTDEGLNKPCRRAIAQSPGPHGSRVHPSPKRRKTSLPRLGDLSSITIRLRSQPESSPAPSAPLSAPSGASEAPRVPSDVPNDGRGYETPADHSDDYTVATEMSSVRPSYITPESSPPTPTKGPFTNLAANIRSEGAKALFRSQMSSQYLNDQVTSTGASNRAEIDQAALSLCLQAAGSSPPVVPRSAGSNLAVVPQTPITPSRPAFGQPHTLQTRKEVFSYPAVKPLASSTGKFKRITSFTQAQHTTIVDNSPAPSTGTTEKFTRVTSFTQPQHVSTVDTSPCPQNNIFRAVYGVHEMKPTVANDDTFKKLDRKLFQLKQLDERTPGREAHIFIDMSNIFIGFEEKCREKRRIPKNQYFHVDPKDFLFSRLHHILARDRPVGKKALAGSVASAGEQISPPAHFLEAQKLDYKTSMMLRVVKFDNNHTGFRPNNAIRRTTGVDVSPYFDWTTSSSGDESSDGSPSILCPRTKLGEQGVDENLHLAMQASILDAVSENENTQPGVMVLATGDAKEAEFSEGFAHYAQKAMAMGWHVEVVSWKRCLSSIWKRTPFNDQYASQFRIIELDPFYEDMLKL
ncbi:hypothetical protein PG991_008807 [Apiospora marii]|uniref:NYN domain-containing protein n=2 Tax=Apiospora marii TaxID=335849 RepID=A0ABR1RN19_9PEZI